MGSNHRPPDYESDAAKGELNQCEYSVYCGDGYPVNWDKKDGRLNIDYDHKTNLNVKGLIPAWVTISE